MIEKLENDLFTYFISTNEKEYMNIDYKMKKVVDKINEIIDEVNKKQNKDIKLGPSKIIQKKPKNIKEFMEPLETNNVEECFCPNCFPTDEPNNPLEENLENRFESYEEYMNYLKDFGRK